MSFAVELTFPAGRYHATPWGSHVNEGLIEWPPSPWRVLRALVACWHRKALDEIERGVVQELVSCLADTLPDYRVPPGWRSHTRHYMPDYKSTNKIYDSFLHLPRGEALCIAWPNSSLSAGAERAAEILFDRLGYLGRAESWVVAKRLLDLPVPNVRAVDQARPEPQRTQETVRLLAPVRPGELSTPAVDPPMRKRSGKARGAPTPPIGILEVLEIDTADVHKGHRDRPPGTKWVGYELSEEVSMEPLPIRRNRNPQPRLEWSVARYAVTGKVVPQLTEALRVGERVHQRLVDLTKELPQRELFTGQDPSGAPLKGHRHVYVYCESLGNEHGRITHVNVCCRSPFDSASEQALRELSRVWGVGESALQLILLGIGGPSDFGGDRVKAGQSPTLGRATSWVSKTPFVPTRYAKTRRDGSPKLDPRGLQIGSPEHDLRRLLAELELPDPTEVEPLEETLVGGRPTRWLKFRTARRSGAGGRRGPSWGAGYRITFPEPVAGPLCVGFGAHFGLGLFEVHLDANSDE